jgi:signal transduction histidine kinase/ligand-binding sensor domain-containing protein
MLEKSFWLPTWRTLVLAAALAALAAHSDAQVPQNALTGYSVESWGEEDGLPSSALWAIVQSTDGYLWVGTDRGLVRFDGLRFSPWDLSHQNLLPTASIRVLLSAGDGSVWAGFGGSGGVVRIGFAEQRRYGPADGLAEGAVAMLFQDPLGTLWAGTAAGLFRLTGHRWLRVEDGLPEGQVYSATVVGDKHFLVGTSAGIFRRPVHGGAFSKVDAGIARSAEADPSGIVWVTDPVLGFRKLNEHPAPAGLAQQGRGNRLLRDQRANLWVGTRGQGLWRLNVSREEAEGSVERATTRAGLSNNGVESLLEDREGNIWVATSDGLNRLTPHKVAQVTDLGLVRGVQVSPAGDVWIGTVDAVVKIPRGDLFQPRSAVGLANATLRAMHVDERGSLWVATNDGLYLVGSDRRSVVPIAGHHQPRQINAIASDFGGGLWLADSEAGLLRWNGGRTTRLPLPADLARAAIVAMAPDRHGRLWVMFEHGRVAAVDSGNSVRVHGPSDGLDERPYRVLLEGRDGTLWFGGADKLTRFKGGRFETLRPEHGLPPGAITAILEDATGALWIALSAAAIVRLDRQDVDKALEKRGRLGRLTSYDRSDGVAGTPQWDAVSNGSRTADGRLWFVTGRGLSILDPGTIDNGVAGPPQVRIEGALADGKPVGVAASASLPPRLARLELDYTALNLTSPLKTRFRYRLDGFDTDWVDAGTRRQAVYTSLPPGAYSFRVVAGNSYGMWNEPGQVWAFSIAPAFYETRWFYAACVAVLALIVGAGWRFHLLQVQREFTLVLSERARLSREIHDTLLQSMVGLALQIDAIEGDVDAAPAMSKERLVRLRKDLTAYIREARQSIRNLRSPMLEQCDLERAVRQAGEHMTAGSSLTFDLAVTGTPRRCPPKVEEQLLRIAQEAVSNALRHAHARGVRAELHYDEGSVALRVRDDGAGFDLAGVLQGEGSHLGLTSMKERAEDVGGMFRVTSISGKGTEVYATVPARQNS